MVNMNTPDSFKFFEYLYADLIRAKELQGILISPRYKLAIWLGIFAPRFVPVAICRFAHLLYLYKLYPLAKIASLINFFYLVLRWELDAKLGGDYSFHIQMG